MIFGNKYDGFDTYPLGRETWGTDIEECCIGFIGHCFSLRTELKFYCYWYIHALKWNIRRTVCVDDKYHINHITHVGKKTHWIGTCKSVTTALFQKKFTIQFLDTSPLPLMYKNVFLKLELTLDKHNQEQIFFSRGVLL